MPNPNETCATCYFWSGDKKKKEGEGQCHRYPPQVAGIVPRQNLITGQAEPAILSSAPSAKAIHWCGEWRVGLDVIPS